jgi:hypothetical protein
VRAGLGYQALADRPPDVGRDQLTLYDIQREGGLPDYFAQLMLDDEAIEAGIARGELVRDRRLERFMSTDPDATDSAGPELVAVYRLAREGFALAERAEGSEDALVQAQRRLEEVSAELQTLSAALQTLRDSKLVRWTAPLRTAYYRLRRGRDAG